MKTLLFESIMAGNVNRGHFARFFAKKVETLGQCFKQFKAVIYTLRKFNELD
jgi:hypothetical protein